MAGYPKMSVEEARVALEQLSVVTQAADPSALAPSAWIQRFHVSVRTVAARDVQYRYRVEGVFGVTMGRLSRRVAALLHDFDGLVEDNPRVTRQEQ